MNSYRCLLFIVVLLLSFARLDAQLEYAVGFIPDSLLLDVNTVIRKDVYEVQVRSQEELNGEILYAVTMLNSDSGGNVFRMGFDPKRKIETFKARVFDANGKLIDSFSKKHAANFSAISSYSIFEDDRVLMHKINHNEYPYTVEFKVSYKQKAFLDLPDFGFNTFGKSLMYANNSMTVPIDYDIKFELENGAPKPVITKDEKQITYAWEVKNLVGKTREPYGPAMDRLYPSVSIVPRVFKFDEYEGSAESWNSFGKFFYQLTENRDFISSELIGKVNQLIKDLSTDEEKIKVLYNYLQENTRYVSVQLGIGGWQPFEASYVEKNEYGDCKALSNFMYALLKVADIKAYPAIIYSDSDYKPTLDPDFPKLFGNHMILYAPDSDTWLECTSTYSPPKYLGASCSNRQALLLTPEGGQLVNTPVLKKKDNSLLRKGTVQINLDGTVEMDMQFKLSGSLQDRWRWIASESTLEEQKAKFLDFFDLSNCQIKQLKTDIHPDLPEITISATLKSDNYLKKIGKRLMLPMNVFGSIPEVPEEVEKRKYRVFHRKNYQIIDELVFVLPENYSSGSTPSPPINLTTPFGSYQQKWEYANEKIVFNRTLEFNEVELPAERYKDLRTFYQDMQKEDQPKILLNPI